MKNMKRSIRRFKTKCIHNKRLSKEAISGYWNGAKTIIEKKKQIQENCPIIQETPKPCSCCQCGHNNPFYRKKIKEDRRNSKKEIREYVDEQTEE